MLTQYTSLFLMGLINHTSHPSTINIQICFFSPLICTRLIILFLQTSITTSSSITDPSTCSYDTVDSGRGASVSMETESEGNNPVMSSSGSSQDTESWSVGENSVKESMSVSTSSTSLSTDMEELQSEGENAGDR